MEKCSTPNPTTRAEVATKTTGREAHPVNKAEDDKVLMQKPWMKCLTSEPTRSAVALSSLVLLKLAFQLDLVLRGFVSVSADEFARGIRAATWALQPQFNIAADLASPWLPFEKYLNGSLLLIWPEVMWAPRVTVFLASCLVLIALFALTYTLFDNFLVAVLASTFIVFQPWYIWLSGTPMLEMYYLACFLGGLVFLVTWLSERYRENWFWAGCCFLLASGFHVQSWILINLVNLLTVGSLYRYIRQERFGRVWRLVGFYALGNLFIVAFALTEFVNTGHVFAFFAGHTSYSKWFYDGYSASVVEKLLYYPKLVVAHSSTVGWFFLFVALASLLRHRTHKGTMLPFAVAIATLIMSSILNVVSVPATAAPERYSFFYVLMISPYVAYGAFRLAAWGRRRWSGLRVYAPAVLSAGLFLYIVGWGLVRIPQFPHGMSKDAVRTGYYLSQMLNESGDMASYMVELKYWDFLAVQLTAGRYDSVVFDREYDPLDRSAPSIFSDKTDDVCARLISLNTRYVALQDPVLKANAQVLGCLQARKEIGNWTVYELNPVSTCRFPARML
jgi:hypothetical protein